MDPARVFNNLDSGEKRRAADWLSSGKFSQENAKVLAAALASGLDIPERLDRLQQASDQQLRDRTHVG